MRSETAPELPARLAACAALVPEGARVADVGCDHGLLALHIARTGRCEFCVATETSPASLARARRPPARAPWARRMAFRTGDGLEALRPGDRIDTIVLAGLGAATIARILGAPRLATLAPRRLVVQPQTDAAAVRRWLVEHGWAIAGERVVRDRGRFYEVVAGEPGDGEAALAHPGLTRDDVLAAGPVVLRSREGEAVALWEARRGSLSRIAAAGRSGAAADRAREGAARARRILAALTSPGG